jgi:hypothetical protein
MGDEGGHWRAVDLEVSSLSVTVALSSWHHSPQCPGSLGAAGYALGLVVPP